MPLSLSPKHSSEPNLTFTNIHITYASTTLRFLTECDGAIMNTTHLFEGKSIEAFQEWFGERPVISLGPLDFSLFEKQTTASTTGMEVKAFLDTAVQKHGPNSVIYVSTSLILRSPIALINCVFQLSSRLARCSGPRSLRSTGPSWM